MITWLLLLMALLRLAYKYIASPYNYWRDMGFPYVKGRFPFGSTPSIVKPTKNAGYVLKDIYDSFKGELCVGFYSFRKEVLLIREPELIKSILVRDFNNFRDRSVSSPSPSRPLAANLFALEGWKWRTMRVKLSPTFTSGKLKLMYSLFQACAERFEKKLAAEVATGDGTVDLKDLIARLTLDIISSCGFGLEVNSIEDEQDPFRLTLKNIFIKPNFFLRWLGLVVGVFPALAKIYRVSAIKKDVEQVFIETIGRTMEFREKNNVRRNDFLDLLLDLKNKGAVADESKDVANGKDDAEGLNKIDMDLNMIAAQCFVFFLAGFETSSTVQTYALYELALNEEIQTKVRKEVMDVVGNQQDISYSALLEMKYLDQVINETMRKYPTLNMLTRICERSYGIPGTRLVIEKGVQVIIPVFALHHDPEYFPDPERFNPDRFDSTNKDLITPFTYLPFGEGPRNCIGMRFGMLQTRLGIASVLRKFRVLPTPTTPKKLEFAASTAIISRLKDQVNLKLEAI